MFQDEVQGQVSSIMCRPVGSVGKRQGVQERVCDGFEDGFNLLHIKSRSRHCLKPVLDRSFIDVNGMSSLLVGTSTSSPPSLS